MDEFINIENITPSEKNTENKPKKINNNKVNRQKKLIATISNIR